MTSGEFFHPGLFQTGANSTPYAPNHRYEDDGHRQKPGGQDRGRSCQSNMNWQEERGSPPEKRRRESSLQEPVRWKPFAATCWPAKCPVRGCTADLCPSHAFCFHLQELFRTELSGDDITFRRIMEP